MSHRRILAPVLTLLLLSGLGFAATPAQALYLSCKSNPGLPTDKGGCWGCHTTSVTSSTIACTTITAVCDGNVVHVSVKVEATAPVTIDVWASTRMAFYHEGPYTTASFLETYEFDTYGGDLTEVWVHIDGREVARATTPCGIP